ncbi:256_t:CDS:2, partial [Entrophospora sp. SA101]
SKVVSEIDDNKNSYGKENDLEMMDVLKLAIKSNNNPIKLFTDELELGPVSKVVSEIDDNKNSNGKENDLEMMDVVDEINETNEIVEWNKVEISHKSNNDPIKLFTVKDLITTEEIMMLGELSMDD